MKPNTMKLKKGSCRDRHVTVLLSGVGVHGLVAHSGTIICISAFGIECTKLPKKDIHSYIFLIRNLPETVQKDCCRHAQLQSSWGKAFLDFLRFSVLSQVLSLTKSKYLHLHWFACLDCFSRGLTVSNIKTASIEHKFFRCKTNIKNVNYFQDRHINTFSLFSLENCHRTKARLMAQLMYLIGLSSLLKLSLQESMLSKS